MAKNNKKIKFNLLDEAESLEEITKPTELVEITEENLKEFADQLQFDTLASECTLEDLAASYGVSKSDMFILIHELKRRGNNVVTMNTSVAVEDEEGNEIRKDITLIRNFGHKKLIDDLSYEIIDNDPKTRIMIISDTRFGSIYQQTAILNDMYQKAKEMGVKYVFLTGDVVEGIYKGAKSIYNTTLHKYGYYDQAEYVASLFPRVEGITTYFITGEHDLSFLKSDSIDIGHEIARRREDMVYLGPRRRKVNITTEDKKGSISFYLQHAKGNVPYTVSYKPQQKIASLRNEDKTNILVTSHFGACDSFLRRGVRSYQVPTVVATTDEMKDATTPVYNTVGAWMITLNKDKKGNLTNTSQMWIPYYNTVLDDYKTAKQLYVTDNKQVYIGKQFDREHIDNVFNIIKNGQSLEEILTKLNTTELKFGGLLEEFKTKGYDIDIVDFSGEKFIIKKKNRVKNNVKPNLKDLTRIRQVWVADSHLCNEAQQLNMLNQVYKEAHDKGYNTVLHFGDMSDGDYQNRGEHRYELFRLGESRQADYIVENYPYVEGIDTYFITGNHDETHEKNGGANIGKDIELRRREINHQLGRRETSDLHFIGNERAYFHPDESPKNTTEMYHSGGGCASSLSYRAQKYIDKMEPGSKPNAIGMGHFHQSHFMSYRNVIALLVPCLTAKSPFAVRQGLENTMGAYFIDMYVNKDGDIEMFEFEEKRFTQNDVKKNDFLRTKQLVLK